MTQTFRVVTPQKRVIIPLTEEAQRMVDASGLRRGVLALFIPHTTAAITTADLDPGTDLDMLEAFEAIVPKFSANASHGIAYRHPHDPAHTPDHILATLIGASLAVPVETGKLVLGEWQEIILVELDGPRERTVVATSIPSS